MMILRYFYLPYVDSVVYRTLEQNVFVLNTAHKLPHNCLPVLMMVT